MSPVLCISQFVIKIFKMGSVRKLSRVMGPIAYEEIKGGSISQRLFSELGLTHFKNGIGILSPLLVKSLRKLENIVRKEMDKISAMEVVLPTLVDSELLKKSDRINLMDLFKLEGKGNRFFALSPTCEEAVTDFMSSVKLLSHKQLPCRLYQISKKFRDEKRAKSGLLRSKEFVMKDLYCFDSTTETSESTYQEVINKYHDLFTILDVPFVRVNSSPGEMGGLKSEEFHYLAKAGEDRIMLCQNCGHNENVNHMKDDVNCSKCQSTNVKVLNGIEVAHAFSLGTRYTEPFKASYINKDENSEFLHMSCFGIGLTRILAASVECLGTKKEIRWPTAIAPYSVCIIPPKEGSFEEAGAKDTPDLIYQRLNEVLEGDIVVDDRTSMTIGKRLLSVQKMGFPFVVIVGKNVLDATPMLEVIDVNSNSKDLVQVSDVSQFILNKLYGGSESVLSCEKNSLMQ